MSGQSEFPFASLDFPGRSTLTVGEIADRLGITEQHLIDLVDEGAFPAVDLAGETNKTSRRLLRIPVEVYRNFIVKRITGPARAELLRQLPKHTLVELHAELTRLITAA